MSKTIHLPPALRPPKQHDLLPDAVGFLARHGRGLIALAEAIDDPWLAAESRTACLAPPTDVGNTDAAARLRDIANMLDEMTEARLRQSAPRFPGPDLAAAYRWYGAKLHDLLR